MSERWSPFSPGLSLWLNGFAKFLRAENDCLVKVRLAPDWMLEMVGLGRSVYSDSDCPDFRLIYLKRFGNFAKLQPGQAAEAGPGRNISQPRTSLLVILCTYNNSASPFISRMMVAKLNTFEPPHFS